MTNHILKTVLEIRRLSAAEAEVWVTVEAEEVTAGTALRGRLVGPRCAGVSTIEVAYPLRCAPRTSMDPPRSLLAQAIIPDPNLWTEQTPFLYEGLVELWQDGQQCDQATFSLGLKTG
jgi:beta-galactosidase/beta-glucuronidase